MSGARPKPSMPVDEFAITRIFLRGMFAWPEDKSSLVRIFGVIYLMPGAIYAMIIMSFICIEPKPGGAVALVQSYADFVGFVTLVFKGYVINCRKDEIIALKELISKDFPFMEDLMHIRAVRRPRRAWPWFPTMAFLMQLGISFIVCSATIVAPTDERVITISTPQVIVRNDLYFYPTIMVLMFVHINFLFISAALDGLFITFTAIIQDKAETLGIALRDLKKCQNNEELNTSLSSIIRYHQYLIQLRNGTEALCKDAALGQLLFVLTTLGNLILQLLYVDLPLQRTLYLVAYLGWVLSQLIVYCVLGDWSTTAGLVVPFEAYGVYRPNMPFTAVRKLILIMMRGQRPLKLTAYGMIQLNNETLLEVLKRCYSISSAVLKMKTIKDEAERAAS